jgi:MFS family permease
MTDIPLKVTPWRAHSTLVLLWLICILANVDRQIMSVLMQPIKLEFGASDTAMGLLSGLAFALLYAILGVPVARMADHGNRSRIVSVCCVIWSAATVMCGMALSFSHLLLARMGVAVGEAGSMAPSVSLVSDIYSKERRSLALSVLLGGGTIGALIGMGLGGWIAQHYGWRTAFLAFGTPGVVLGLLAWVAIYEPRTGLARVMAAAGAAAARQPATERMHEQILRLLRVPAFLPIATAIGILAIVGMSLAIWMPSFLVRSHGLTIAQAGIVIGVTGMISVVGAILSGWLCDRLVKRDQRWQLGMPAVSVLIGMPGAVFFLLCPQGNWMIGSFPVPHALLGTMWFGFFGSGYSSMTYSALSSMVVASDRAVAIASINLASVLFGLGLGPLVAGALSDALMPQFGVQGLRWALVSLVCTLPLASLAYCYALAPFQRRVNELELQTLQQATMSRTGQGGGTAGEGAGYRHA